MDFGWWKMIGVGNRNGIVTEGGEGGESDRRGAERKARTAVSAIIGGN